jgi:hypothetical protein
MGVAVPNASLSVALGLSKFLAAAEVFCDRVFTGEIALSWKSRVKRSDVRGIVAVLDDLMFSSEGDKAETIEAKRSSV